MTQRDIVVVGLARTAIGTFGGSLKDVPLSQLGTTAVRAALQRSGVDAAAVGHVVMGSVAERVVRLATMPVLTVHGPVPK